MGPASLPADVKGRIDEVVRKVSSASEELAARTSSNSTKIRAALEIMYVCFLAKLNLQGTNHSFSLEKEGITPN